MKVSVLLLITCAALAIQASPTNWEEEEISQNVGLMRAKPKQQKCEKLGGKCMPKKSEKKCKGKIDKMGKCQGKKDVCCTPKKPKPTKAPKPTKGPKPTEAPKNTEVPKMTEVPTTTEEPTTTEPTTTEEPCPVYPSCPIVFCPPCPTACPEPSCPPCPTCKDERAMFDDVNDEVLADEEFNISKLLTLLAAKGPIVQTDDLDPKCPPPPKCGCPTCPPLLCPPQTCPPCMPCPTKPPTTKPPATKPQPPATKPPATKPPATKPPATKPPATKPPKPAGTKPPKPAKKPQKCEKLKGKCMSKKSAKKCKGVIENMGECKGKKDVCCVKK